MFYRLVVKREEGWREISRVEEINRNKAILFFSGHKTLTEIYGQGKWSVTSNKSLKKYSSSGVSEN